MDDALARRRSRASIDLLLTSRLADETSAWDVLVNDVYAGHWSETAGGRAAVTWVGGEWFETESCDDDPENIVAAVRRTVPASRLPAEVAPKYDVPTVEAVILEEVAKRHPKHLTSGGVLRKIVSDPDDKREMETGVQAISNLRGVGLLTHRADERVEPTPAARRAVRLLT